VEIRPAPAYCLTIDGPMGTSLSADSDNLVTRAIEGLASILSRPPAVTARLTKRLPTASGIGGGSADAAAALRAALTLWSPAADAREIEALALRLGADVPVCLTSAPRRMQGIGELLTPLPPLPACPILLVNPGVPTPTGAVFKARRAEFSQPMEPPVRPLDGAKLAELVRYGGNDLAAPARQLVPVIDQVLASLEAQPGCLAAAMSGSGATCFGLFNSPATASTAAEVIGRAQPGWWTAASHLLR
jgi:4-diphosphocytidyl-2-C-methyl-D-erythritol kinase